MPDLPIAMETVNHMSVFVLNRTGCLLYSRYLGSSRCVPPSLCPASNNHIPASNERGSPRRLTQATYVQECTDGLTRHLLMAMAIWPGYQGDPAPSRKHLLHPSSKSGRLASGPLKHLRLSPSSKPPHFLQEGHAWSWDVWLAAGPSFKVRRSEAKAILLERGHAHRCGHQRRTSGFCIQLCSSASA
jgi:hypothetical protein